MSLVQLRERIIQIKEEKKQQEEKIREQNSLKKDEKLFQLKGMVHNIQENRQKL